MPDEEPSVLQRWRELAYTSEPIPQSSISAETTARRHEWEQALLWLMTTSIQDLRKPEIVKLLSEVQQIYRSLTLQEKRTAGLAPLSAAVLPDTSPLTQRHSRKKSPPSANTRSPT